MSLPGQFFFTAQRQRVYVVRVGAEAGVPLVVLHGLMLSHYYFAPILDELGASRPVIAIDLLGFGESDKPSPDDYDYRVENQAECVVELLGQLGIARFDLLGHSMGGAIALEIAARLGERVRRVATIAAACFPLPLDARQRLLLTAGIGDVLWNNLVTRAELARQFRNGQAYRAADIHDDFLDYVWARFNRPGGRAAALAAARAVAFRGDPTPSLVRVHQPVLVMHGEQDHLVPVGNGKRLHTTLPSAQLAIIAACGHHPVIERPRLVMRHLDLHYAARQLGHGGA